MRANDKKRAHAERLYIEEGWTAKDIAEAVGVSEHTVGSWIKKFNWKDEKTLLDLAPHKLKRLLLGEMDKVLNGEKLTFNSDDLSKISRALERIDKSITVPVVISVIKELDKWLLTYGQDSDFISESLKFHKSFIQQRIELE
ncbi:MAG: helix-turn-helix domain-containing protein [Crocinitomicaceae bacterium]|nr:helix-turn-helix domain-containing protein [Crocinitomicaceae bacterium]